MKQKGIHSWKRTRDRCSGANNIEFAVCKTKEHHWNGELPSVWPTARHPRNISQRPSCYDAQRHPATPSDAQRRPASTLAPIRAASEISRVPSTRPPKDPWKLQQFDPILLPICSVKSSRPDAIGSSMFQTTTKKKFQKRTLYSTGANSTEPNRLFGVPMDQNHQIGFQIGFSSSDSPWRKCQRIELGIFRTAFENPPNCVDKNNCAKWADPKCCVNIWLNKKLKINANRLVDCTKIRPNCNMNRID